MSVKGKRQERQTIYIYIFWQGLLGSNKAGAIDDAPASIVEGLALVEKTGGVVDALLP